MAGTRFLCQISEFCKYFPKFFIAGEFAEVKDSILLVCMSPLSSLGTSVLPSGAGQCSLLGRDVLLDATPLAGDRREMDTF